ncbi:MAG: hypothetical protein QG663_115, partial [Thermodesulfobacteriota bacterium]|nr:hypothetical protein [Thermodesulfobacteriota bacterium]
MTSLVEVICIIAILGMSLVSSPTEAREFVGVIVVDVQGDFTTAQNGSLA